MGELDLIALLRTTSPVTRFVLAILVIFSIWSWGIILSKALLLRKIRRETEVFWKIFRKARNLSEVSTAAVTLRFTPLVPVFNSGAEIKKDNTFLLSGLAVWTFFAAALTTCCMRAGVQSLS